MTLILGCITNDFIVQVSDRRLTDLRTGLPLERAANKLVVDHAHRVFGYTGIAAIGHQATDHWLAETIARVSANRSLGSFQGYLSALAAEATKAFKRMRPRKRSDLRHAFMCTGWTRTGVQSERIPILAVISNALAPNDEWADEPSESFGVQYHRLARGELVKFRAAGAPLSTADKFDARRKLRRALEADCSPMIATQFLIDLLLTIARPPGERGPVGDELMVTCIPRVASEAAAATGAFMSIVSVPDRQHATFAHLSPREIIPRSPLFASGGFMVEMWVSANPIPLSKAQDDS